MCKFCENIKDNNKEFILAVRSTYADDNICEFVNDQECGKCNKCDMHFILQGYKHSNNTYISVEYSQEIISSNDTEVIIRPFSESIHFNYCPFCGKQISENILEFDRCGFITLKDKED